MNERGEGARRGTLRRGWRAAMIAAGWLVAATLRAQVDIGEVFPTGGRTVQIVSVPPFEPREGSAPMSDPALFSRVVANDLALSGYFGPPRNPQFELETHRLDLQRNTIDFAAWRRIGVNYLVRGAYWVSGDQLRATVRVFDVVSGDYVLGREYTDYRLDEARRLAHRISDDIFRQLTGEPGFASTKLLFVRQNDPFGRSKQVCIMDADGFNLQPLTGDGELTATPAWGMNATEIYYTTYRDFNPDLEGMILRDRTRWWVSRRAGFNLSPAWSQTRGLIALTLTRDGNSELYTIRRDGTDLRRLTNNRAIDSSPCWNRDGTQIVFTSDRSGSPQLYILDVATLEVRRLTYEGDYNDGAVWSPAGPELIAYHSRINGQFQIFTIAPDGSNRRQLTTEGSNEDPTWSPNGRVLAFTSTRGGVRQIYTMFAADGTIIAQLTRGSQPCQSPAWSPLLD